MADDDDLDIYENLEDFKSDQKIKELESENANLKKRIQELEDENTSLKTENKKLSKRESSLSRNISVLFTTAVAELDFKTKELASLVKERDSILFRRGEFAKPNSSQPLKEDVSIKKSEETAASKTSANKEKDDVSNAEQKSEQSSQGKRVLRSNARGRSRRPSRGNSSSSQRKVSTEKEVCKESEPNPTPTVETRRSTRVASKKKSESVSSPRQCKTGKPTEKPRVKVIEEDLLVAEKSSENSKPCKPTGILESLLTNNIARNSGPSEEKDREGSPMITPNNSEKIKASVKVDKLEKRLQAERNSENSLDLNTSSAKENTGESKILKAERIHKEIEGRSPISLVNEITKLSPRTNSVDGDGPIDSNVSESHKDLLSSLLKAETERVMNTCAEKKKWNFSDHSPRDSPETPGKFLLDGSFSEKVFKPSVEVLSGSDKSLSPEFIGPPQTPGKHLLSKMFPQKEISPNVSDELARKELNEAVNSILPTPLKILPDLLSPLKATPVNAGPPQQNITPESQSAATTHEQSTVQSPNQTLNSSITSANSTQLVMDLSRVSETPKSKSSGFPFRRKRVLKITCVSSNGSMSAEEKNNSSVGEPPEKKVCPAVQDSKPCVLSPIKFPKSPEQILKEVPMNPEVPKSNKPTPPAKKTKPPLPGMSPAVSMATPKRQVESQPASLPSSGRKSNDSCNSQDFQLHYTSGSEISRSPSPFVSRQPAMSTSTPNPSKHFETIANSLTCTSAKRKLNQRYVQLFGDSPCKDHDDQMDMHVSEEMRRDLEECGIEIEPEKHSPPDCGKGPRSARPIREDKKGRRSPDRFFKIAPNVDHRRSPETLGRVSPERIRRRTPEDQRRPYERDRRSPEKERIRLPERESRRDLDRKYKLEVGERRRSPPYEKERRMLPIDYERRKHFDERRRSPEFRDKRRPPDERDLKYRRKSRSPEQAGYLSSSRRSPGSYHRKEPPYQRSASPYETRRHLDYGSSHQPREECRRFHQLPEKYSGRGPKLPNPRGDSDMKFEHKSKRESTNQQGIAKPRLPDMRRTPVCSKETTAIEDHEDGEVCSD